MSYLSTATIATKIGAKIGSAACASTSASSPANVVVERTGSLSAYSIDLLLQSACPDPLSTHISPLPLLPLCVARAELKKRQTESVAAGDTVMAASAESEYRALCWGRARAALATVNVHCAQPGGAFEDDDGGQYVHHDQGQGFDDQDQGFDVQGQECDQEQDQDCHHEDQGQGWHDQGQGCHHEDSGHGHDGKQGHECAEDAEGDEHEEGHGYSQHAGCTDYHDMQNSDECEDGPQAEYAEHADDAEDHNSHQHVQDFEQNSEYQAQETELPSYGESSCSSSYGGSFPPDHGIGYCDGDASDVGGYCDNGFAEQANGDDHHGHDGGDYNGGDY